MSLVALGGAIGAVVRSVIDYAIPHAAGPVAWDIIAVNMVGSLALGIIAGHIEQRTEPRWYPLLGPGLLGGFTTFSAAAAARWAIETPSGIALALLAGTMLAAVVAAGAGWAWSAARRKAEA